MRQADGRSDWQPVPAERAVIRRMLADRARGLPYRVIAERLELEGIAPRGGQR